MTTHNIYAGQKSLLLWGGAMLAGCCLGWLGIPWLNGFLHFVGAVFTRLFRFLAVPTIALAVTTTLAQLGVQADTKRIFLRTITYTLLTTLAAAVTGLLLFIAIAPENLPQELIAAGEADAMASATAELTYADHILSVIPDNIILPFSTGNVLSVLLIAAAAGLTLAKMPPTENTRALLRGILGLQELLFALIRALIRVLPVGILAFSAELAAEFAGGHAAAGSLGRYVLVILGGNLLQTFVVLPLFLCARGLNPLKTLRAMLPAVLTAFFTKSSAATLPVTMNTAEGRLGVKREVARFVLPLCTTINMNGCAAFILVTSLFVMQNGGIALTLPAVLLWVLISVVSAVGNAGVPMGCFFLTLSLMAGIGAPVSIMGLILPIFTVIDMVETAENVWSDSCVCAMTDHDLKGA